MSRIRISIDSVLRAGHYMKNAADKVEEVLNLFTTTTNGVDDKIKNASSVQNKINDVQNLLREINRDIRRIDTTAEACANHYFLTEQIVADNGKKIGFAATKRGYDTARFFEHFFVSEKRERIKKLEISDLVAVYSYLSKKTAQKTTDENKELIKMAVNVMNRIGGLAEGIDKTNSMIDTIKEERIGKYATPQSKKKSSAFGVEEIALFGSSISYLSKLANYHSSKYDSWYDIGAGTCDLTDGSISLFGDIYGYIEGKLDIDNKIKFGQKYQKKIGILSVIGSFVGTAGETVKAVDTYLDKKATSAEKVNQTAEVFTSSVDFGKSIYDLKKGVKTIQSIKNGTEKAWDVMPDASKAMKKAGYNVTAIKAYAKCVASGYETYTQVSKDGFVSSDDISSIGLRGSVSGLLTIADAGSFGVFNLEEKADAVSDSIDNFAKTTAADYCRKGDITSKYIESQSQYWEYANRPDTPFAQRAIISVGTGIGMIGATAVQGVKDIGSWAVNGIKNIF